MDHSDAHYWGMESEDASEPLQVLADKDRRMKPSRPLLLWYLRFKYPNQKIELLRDEGILSTHRR